MPASAVPIDLPKVDLSGFHASGRDRAAFLADLRRILHEHGFFYLTGHGVASSLIADVIRASKGFFALPQEEKLAIEMANSPHFPYPSQTTPQSLPTLPPPPSHKLLGTREWFVIHHTDCGMELFDDATIGNLLDDNLETAVFDGQTWSNPKHGGGSGAGHYVRWLTIHNLAQSVVEDVKRIREHPLVPKHIPVYGYIYDVKTGRLLEVEAATAAGRATEQS